MDLTPKIDFNKIISLGLSKELTLDETMHLAFIDGMFKTIHLDIRMSIVSSLQEKGLVNYDEETAKVSINPRGKAIFKAKNQDNSDLAKQLREMYPGGLKDDRWPWRGTNVEIKAKLDKFREIYPEAEDQQIIDATKLYLAKMKDNDQGRSLLGYFILKSTPDGIKSILAQYIEMGEDVKGGAKLNPKGNTMQI